jgi:hypothetical protein
MARHAALPLAGSNRQAASAGYTKVDERTHDWADSLPRNPFGHWVPRHARMNGWRVLGSDKGDRNVSSVGGSRHSHRIRAGMAGSDPISSIERYLRCSETCVGRALHRIPRLQTPSETSFAPFASLCADTRSDLAIGKDRPGARVPSSSTTRRTSGSRAVSI